MTRITLTNDTAIRRALHALLGHIKAPSLRSSYLPFRNDFPQFPNIHEQHLLVQSAARRIADHFKLSHTTFIVEIDSSLQSAAQIEVTPSNEIFVKYKPGDFLDTVELVPVMAHEIAHIFLDRAGLSFTDTFQNEVLTDVAICCLGFGHSYLSAQRSFSYKVDRSRSENRTNTFGYITPDEIGFVLSVRQCITGENIKNQITSEYGRESFERGYRIFTKRLNSKPFVQSKLSRFFHSTTNNPNKTVMEFKCPICSQNMRVPLLRKKIIVTCPNCSTRLPCYS